MSRRLSVSLVIAAWFASATCCSAQDSRPKTQATSTLEVCRVGGIQKIHKLGKVYLAGQPSVDDFQVAKKQEGLKTVINLRQADEMEFDEAATLKTLGVAYHHLPFRAPETLKDEVFDQARKILSDKKNYPIMMHCASANRVGAVWLAYRVLDEQVPYEQALAEAKKVGLKSPDFEGKAKDYIGRKSVK